MDNSNRKSPLKKLKSKLFGKIFCQSNDQNITDAPSLHNDAIVATSSSAVNSIQDNEFRNEEASGAAQYCSSGVKHVASELLHNIGSSSYFSDDERSGSDLTQRKSKRKKRWKSTESRKRTQQESSSSSSSCAQALDIIPKINVPNTVTGEHVARNKKRKLKKKQRETEKKPESTAYTGISSDST